MVRGISLLTKQKSLFKRVPFLMGAAAFLASTLISFTPFWLSNAQAASASYTYVPFTSAEISANWMTDRYAPSGGYGSVSYGGRSNVLELNIDNTNASPSAGFYRTEGIQRQIPASDTIRADVYVDGSWLSKDARAGLWGVGQDSSGNISAYPIIEFTTAGVGDFTGWRIWDSADPGGWVNKPLAAYNTDSWNTLELSVDKADSSKTNVYVNGSFAGISTGDPTESLKAVIFNDYNYATGSHADDYSAHWSNFAYGIFVPDVPTASLNANNTGASVSNGGSTNSEYFTFHLSSGSDATRYRLKYWNDIAGSPFKISTPWNPADLSPYSPSLGTYVDHFTQGQGTHYFAFSACDTASCSDYLSPFVVKYDTSKPSIPSITAPTSNQYLETSPILNSWSASTDNLSGISKYQVWYTYDDGHIVSGSTCSDIPSGVCRDATGTSRNHSPALNEQCGVTIRVRAVDRAGNISDWSTPVHYYYDATVLTVPTLVSPVNNAIVKGASLTNSWQPVANATKYIYESYNNSSATSLRWHQELTATSKTATNVGNATFWWRVRAVDQYGKLGPWSDLWKVTIDNDSPTTPALMTPTNNSYLSTHNFTFTWNSASDTSPVTYEWESSYSNGTNIDGSFSSQLAHHNNFGTSVNSPGTPDGTYYWHVRAIDAAGNASSWSPIWKTTVDTVAPQVQITAPSSMLLSGNVEINGSVTDINPHHYWLVIQNISNSTVTGPGVVNDYNSFNDRYFFTWDTTAVNDGTYTIKLEARDAANNKDSNSVQWMSVTVDNTAPTAVVDALSTMIMSPGLTGTVDDNDATIDVAIGGNTYIATNNGDGTWTLPENTINPALTPGSYDVTVTATDPAGNNSTNTATDALTITAVQGANYTASSTQPNGGVGSGAGNAPGVVGTNNATGTDPTFVAAENTSSSTLGETASGINAQNNTPAGSGGKILGLMWYWWMLILAGITGAAYGSYRRLLADSNK